MNFLDIIFLIFAIWFGFKGFKNGLISELASIVALIGGIWVTFKFSDSIAGWLGDDRLYKILAYVIIFVGVLIIVHFAGKIVEMVIKLVIPDLINNLFGLAFGVAKVMLLLSVFIYFINIIDTKDVILKEKFINESFTYKYIEPMAPYIINHWE